MKIASWEFESPPLHVLLLLYCCGNSSVGRAQPCQGWGREFESRFPLFDFQLNIIQPTFLKLAQVAELVDAHVSGACVFTCRFESCSGHLLIY